MQAFTNKNADKIIKNNNLGQIMSLWWWWWSWCHYNSTTVLNWWCGMLWILSSSFPSPYSYIPIILVQLIFVLSVHMMFCTGPYSWLSANSAFLFLRLTSCLHLVDDALYSLMAIIYIFYTLSYIASTSAA